MDVYRTYFNNTGLKSIACVILMNIIYQVSAFLSNFWLSKWDSILDDSQYVKIGVYAILGITQGKFSL